MNDWMKEYRRWLDADCVSDTVKAELRAIGNDADEIKLRFSDYMVFGTGGLRATMKAGTANMNTYTVAHATQGLAELIKRENACEKGAVVCRDSRINSDIFAMETASVLAANGIKVYYFDGIRPTPVLSYAVRRLGCITGINVTASHNPKQYNGYKVYWADGAQLPPEHADIVAESIASLDIFADVKHTDFSSAVSDGRIRIIGADIDEAYMSEVLAQTIDKDAIPSVADNFAAVYTPLHGTGYRLVPEVLRRAGLKNLYTVTEQCVADGSFPTASFPNPEKAEVFKLGTALADANKCDLVVATDPDADRVGVCARDKTGAFRTITGNQMGALLIDYIIRSEKQLGTLAPDAYVVKTIVTSELAAKICAKNNVKIVNVLTGFKYIGEKIAEYDDATPRKGTYLFGFEESYGYLKGTYARDKDAVVASMLIVEMAAAYAKKGMTLCDALEGLFAEYGYFREAVADIVLEGVDGNEKRVSLMQNLKKAAPRELAGHRVAFIRDYDNFTKMDVATGVISEMTGLPKSDVIHFETAEGDVCVVRPSGTEPKVKLYVLVSGATLKEADDKANAYLNALREICRP